MIVFSIVAHAERKRLINASRVGEPLLMALPDKEELRDGGKTVEIRTQCDEIKRRLDHKSFYLHYCPEAQISGEHLKANCPIPEHHHSGNGKPGLSVDLRRGLYHCFSRHDGGDAIRFYEQVHGVSFVQAVREICRAHLGVGDRPAEIFVAAGQTEDASGAVDESLAPELQSAICAAFLKVCAEENQLEGETYLARRGINRKTMRRAGVVYFPRAAYRRIMRKLSERFSLDDLQLCGLFNEHGHLTFYRHRLVFPFHVEKRPVYLQARTTVSGIEPRWFNMRGTVPALYNVDCLASLQSDEIVYLVEGFTDTLTLMAHNFPALGLVGAGGFKAEWLSQLTRFRVVMALDGDAAGKRAAKAYQQFFSTHDVALARLNLATDVNDFFRHHPTAALEFSLLTEAALEEAGRES